MYVRPFFVRSSPLRGDGMRKKDTEIPPKHAFIYCRLILPFRPIGMHI
jgi:hypothetical protein